MTSGPTQENIDRYLRDSLLPTIERCGFAVQGVFAVEEWQTSFCYTVGLTTRGWPELICLGPTDAGMVILNGIVAALDELGLAPTVGDLPDIFGTGYILRLRECSTRSNEFPFSSAHAIYPDVTGLQVLLPDAEHRYPGEPGCELDWQILIEAP